MSEIRTINQSQIATFTRCGEQWRRRYVEHEIIPPGSALIRGQAVHKASQKNFTQKIKTRKDMKKKDVVEVALETVKEIIKNDGLLLSEDERSVGHDITVNETEKTAKGLTELYSDEIAPEYQPVMVEEEERIVLPGDEIIVKGTVDMSDENGVIVDLKTKSRKSNGADYHTSPQLTTYALLKTIKTGKPPTGIVIEELVAKAKPERYRVLTHRTKDDFVALLSQIDAIAKTMKSGNVVPAYGQAGAWWCSKKFCGFWSTCQFVPKNRR